MVINLSCITKPLQLHRIAAEQITVPHLPKLNESQKADQVNGHALLPEKRNKQQKPKQTTTHYTRFWSAL